MAFSLTLARVKLPPERLAPQRHFFRQSLEGYVYAVRHPGIGQMMVLFAVTAVGIRGYNEMFPGFADAIYHRGAQALAWLTATMGLGAMTGGVWMLRRGGVKGLTTLAINYTLVMSLSVLAFAGATSYWIRARHRFRRRLCHDGERHQRANPRPDRGRADDARTGHGVLCHGVSRRAGARAR